MLCDIFLRLLNELVSLFDFDGIETSTRNYPEFTDAGLNHFPHHLARSR